MNRDLERNDESAPHPKKQITFIATPPVPIMIPMSRMIAEPIAWDIKAAEKSLDILSHKMPDKSPEAISVTRAHIPIIESGSLQPIATIAPTRLDARSVASETHGRTRNFNIGVEILRELNLNIKKASE